MFSLNGVNNYRFKWIDNVKSIFDSIGLSYIWSGQHVLHDFDIKNLIKQKMLDAFYQQWFHDMGNSSRGELYNSFKQEFGSDKYLINLSKANRFTVCRLRCSNTKFPVETGRWAGISLEHRICNICTLAEVGNEFHYLFKCNHPEIQILREKYIPYYYVRYPSLYKMYGLFSICNVKVMCNLAIFLRKVEKLL